MTMHLQRGLTTLNTSTKKKKRKITKAKLERWTVDLRKYNKQMKSLGMHNHMMTMDQYIDGNWHGTKKVKAGFAGSQMKRFLDWDYLKEVKDIWKGPVVLKGIMHSDDAVKASRIIDCIYLSNHGGRQLDLAPSPIQILPEVRKSLKTVSYTHLTLPTNREV